MYETFKNNNANFTSTHERVILKRKEPMIGEPLVHPDVQPGSTLLIRISDGGREWGLNLLK